MALSISLVCAVLASLALGVLVAYGICCSMFRLFRIHARQLASRNAAAGGNAAAPIASARALNN